MRKSIAVLLAAAISVNTIVASSSAMYNYNDGADIGITAAAAETMVASNYIISRGVPAYSEKSNNASSANDDKYYTSWTGTAEDYIAYDLSSVPASQRKKVIAVWYNNGTYDNIGIYVNKADEPADYTIEVNSAQGGGYPSSGWKTIETVTGNGYSSRQHLVDMDGYNWIRMRVTKANGSKISLNFDIHDASNGINDSWIFFGDSITAGSMGNAYGTGFAVHVNMLDNRFYPVQENGGIGGITSHDGKENIDKWLSTSCAKYVSIAYGTNDAWGNPNNIQSYYENTKYMIDAVLKAGKVPVLPTIPYASDANAGKYTVDYNAKVTQLYNEYGDKLLHGPDFYAFFKANSSYLSQDGVHPSSDGYEAMRKLWAETMIENLYSKMPMMEIPEDKPDVDTLMGDVNGDKKVNVADAVLFQKWLLAVKGTKLDNPAAADVFIDNVLDVYDMILLRKLIVGGSSMPPQNPGGKYEKVYEAEDAAISGGNKVNYESSASGGEYVGNFAEDTDGLSFEIEVPSDGIYTLTFTSKGIGGDKINNVYVDNNNVGEFKSSGEGYTDYSIRRVMLTAGKHIVSIKKSWGWIALDKLTISTDEVN